MMRMITAACVAALGLWGSEALADQPTPTMNMSGTGTVKAEPDEGYITVGVVSHSAKSSDAVRLNATAMDNLYKTLGAFGVKKSNIQTIEFSVQPNYKQVEYRDENGRTRSKSVQDGFNVVNMVRVTVCELESFGKVLDAVVDSGANRIQSIQFGSSKSADLLDEARAKACADAIRKGRILANGFGVNLGAVRSVSESRGYRSTNVYRSAMVSGEAAADTPLSGGTLSFSVTVNVTWELVPRAPRKPGAASRKPPVTKK